MRVVVAGYALVFCFVIPSAASAQNAAADRVFSVPEYIAELEAVEAALATGATGASDRADALLDHLPEFWRVDGNGRVFEIPADWLSREFRRWRATRDAAAYDRMLARLETLRSEARHFQESPADFSQPRSVAAEILNEREFRNVHGPTWIDRLRQRVYQLMNRLFAGMYESSAFPTISRTLVYVLLAAAGITAIVWLSRFRRRPAQAQLQSAVDGAAPETVAWTHWLAQADAAAAAGRWRDAVHCSYWCAVSFLEKNGAWSADRTRTPREYVRLLPQSSGARPALAALTRLFERVWYGTDQANADAFAEVTTHLKKLGCLTG
jgi:Domain of unknown function (DUF4129)